MVKKLFAEPGKAIFENGRRILDECRPTPRSCDSIELDTDDGVVLKMTATQEHYYPKPENSGIRNFKDTVSIQNLNYLEI